MKNSPTHAYLEAEASSIPPLKLVRLVNAGAIHSLQRAVQLLRKGERSPFVRAVGKAQDLIAELHKSLDHDRGSDIARQLDKLYEWMQRTLTAACLQGKIDGIEHVIRVLGSLQEGWDGVRDERELVSSR